MLQETELCNFFAGYLVAEHLIKLGCRRLAFVTRSESAPTVDARIAGSFGIRLVCQVQDEVCHNGYQAYGAQRLSRPEIE